MQSYLLRPLVSHHAPLHACLLTHASHLRPHSSGVSACPMPYSLPCLQLKVVRNGCKLARTGRLQDGPHSRAASCTWLAWARRTYSMPSGPLTARNHWRIDFNSSIPQDGMQSVVLFYSRSRWLDLHRVTPGVCQPAQKTICTWATWSPGTV